MPALGALALLAPLEYATGRGIGLGPAHAATITTVIEGFTAYAVAAGRLAWLALVISTLSAAVGLFRSVEAEALVDGRPVTWQQLAIAAGITLLSGVALGGTHWIRSRTGAERAAAAAQLERAQLDRQAAAEAAEASRAREAAELDERRAQAEHERAIALQRAQSWAERDRLSAEARLEHERAEAARARLEGELQIERERAAREQDRAEAERQRASAERMRAQNEQAAEQRRARAERERVAAELAAAAEAEADAEAQRIRADRSYARTRWLEERWPPAELAARRGVSEGRARADIAEWRTADDERDEERQTA